MLLSRLAITTLPLCGTTAGRALRGMTPCERRRWHVDIERPGEPGCSNSWKVPSSWRLPANEARMFYESSGECCSDLFGEGECNVVDFCECEAVEENACAVVTRSKPSDPLRHHCGNDPKWHFDVDTKEGCTNSPRFPEGWRDPAVAPEYLFDTPTACCEKFTVPGVPCMHHDVCAPYKKEDRDEQLSNEIKVDMEEFLHSSDNITNEKIKMHNM